MLNAHNPDLMSSGSKSYKIPPPQCLREGNKKTIFANIAEICRRMKRSDEHVTQFLFAELGTTGSTDGSRRLVIKGKFLQKQIESVLRHYIGRYPATPSLKQRLLTSDQSNMSLARPVGVLTLSLLEVRIGKCGCLAPQYEETDNIRSLYFIECNSCASRRSVQSVNRGFIAQVGKRRRQQG